ncbi:hypothetical protein [Neisseria benedictiae]|uniref:hypothetical protein n=1 Tax=Neisseria benedictiae TaxID=2830649 RepID=UPI002658241E|nr:hypothetical protein [Neisseria benedictiae]
MKKLAVLTALAGCKEQAAQKPPVDQSRICIYSNDEEARKCVNGELPFFNPTQWGNEQLPLFVVAQKISLKTHKKEESCIWNEKSRHFKKELM